MDGIFINYRREDSAPYAGRLYDFLCRTYPQNKVFMDIDSMEPGEDFVDAINATLTASRVVIAVIGPNWTKVTDSGGNRRLDNPDDYVVRELSAALKSSARVIPVLVGGVKMPPADTLPHSLQPLARRNAIEISDTRFVTDAERLKGAISRVIQQAEDRSPPTQRPADSPIKASADFADALTIFKTLVWTDFLLTIVVILFLMTHPSIMTDENIKAEEAVVGIAIMGIVVLGLSAWFNVKLIRGKNWARMAFIALFVVTLPAYFEDFSKKPTVYIALEVVALVLSVWIIRVMFSEPVRQIFLKR